MRIIVQRRNIKEKIQSTRDHISNLMTTASDKVYIVVKHQQSWNNNEIIVNTNAKRSKYVTTIVHTD